MVGLAMKKPIEKIVRDKLTEHVAETEATQEELDKLRNDSKKVQKDSETKLLNAQKVMILKDKMMFHKACSMILQDILDEANK